MKSPPELRFSTDPLSGKIVATPIVASPVMPRGRPQAKPHPWEVAGLGTAPFYRHREDTAPAEAKVTCDVCGQHIGRVFWVRDAKSAEFKVGSKCINKVKVGLPRRTMAEIVAAIRKSPG